MPSVSPTVSAPGFTRGLRPSERCAFGRARFFWPMRRRFAALGIGLLAVGVVSVAALMTQRLRAYCDGLFGGGASSGIAAACTGIDLELFAEVIELCAGVLVLFVGALNSPIRRV